jgi:hypothetical protein
MSLTVPHSGNAFAGERMVLSFPDIYAHARDPESSMTKAQFSCEKLGLWCHLNPLMARSLALRVTWRSPVFGKASRILIRWAGYVKD